MNGTAGNSCTTSCTWNDTDGVCLAPVNVTVTSHASGYSTTATSITLTGTYTGPVTSIVVVYVSGTQMVTGNATLNLTAKTWSVTVPLQIGNNPLWIKAFGNDVDCKDTEELTIIRTNGGGSYC